MNTLERRNRQLLTRLLVIVGIMTGFGFALVPLYKQICEATGISQGRVPDSLIARNTQVDDSRWITVEFVANNNEKLAWQFEPLVKSMRVHPGQIGEVRYRVVNTTGREVVGQAVPSYGPSYAAKHFKKVQCFCFSKQALAPNERRDMQVVFVISPELPREVEVMTLSYTFFDVTPAGRPS